jgi:hypothetical protein
MAEPTSGRNQRTLAMAFGTANLVSAALIYLGIFQGLPARWWPVDGAGGVVIALFAAAGVALLSESRWAATLARVASVVSLVIGLLLVAAVALTASYLSGIYGPVGHGGALILTLTAALALPFLVLLPAGELLWLGPRRSATDEKAKPTPERT